MIKKTKGYNFLGERFIKFKDERVISRRIKEKSKEKDRFAWLKIKKIAWCGDVFNLQIKIKPLRKKEILTSKRFNWKYYKAILKNIFRTQ